MLKEAITKIAMETVNQWSSIFVYSIPDKLSSQKQYQLSNTLQL